MRKRFIINEEKWLEHFGGKTAMEIAEKLGVSHALIYEALKEKSATKKLAKKLIEIDPKFITHTVISSVSYKRFNPRYHIVKKPFKLDDLI